MQKAKIIPYSAFSVDLDFYSAFEVLLKVPFKKNVLQLSQQIEEIFINDPYSQKLLITLCVRSSFDLFLQAVDLPLGSEVIMTCINIPNMHQIVKHHGLVPVPIEVDKDYLQTNIADLKNALTPKSKVLVISYVYGVNYDATELIKFAKDNGLYVVEDQAEAFYDTKYNGNPLADLSMYSFGTIKTCTAFGGSLCVVRNNDKLFHLMRNKLFKYEKLSKEFFIKRVLKNLVVMTALSPVGNWKLRTVTNLINFNYKEKFVHLVRGFTPNEDFLSTFRFQLPDEVISLLYKRLSTFDKQKFDEATKNQIDVQKIFIKNGIHVLGHKTEGRHFWLFPILTDDVKLTQDALNRRGVDAYVGATQLQVVPHPSGQNELCQYFNNILYLPIHNHVPKREMLKIVNETIGTIKQLRQTKHLQDGQNVPKL